MTLIDGDTGEIVCTPEQARALTDRIKVGVEAVWHLIVQAYEDRAWAALGYSSWDDYCTREFGTSRLRLPREERQDVVASLRESGLSIRAIAAATGDGVATVKRALDAGVPNGTPDDEPEPPQPVTGSDGKSYPAKRTPRKKGNKPNTTKAVALALYKLAVAAEAFEAIDARKLSTYAEEVPVWSGNLSESMKAIHAFHEQLKGISK